MKYQKSFLLSVLLCSVNLFAVDPPQRGILVDGTPFRTDSEGNQIIDYVAQLEHSVDHLKQKVYSFELEVENDKLLIERLRADGPDCKKTYAGKPTLEEKNLLPQKTALSPDLKDLGLYKDLQNEVLSLEQKVLKRNFRIKKLEAQLLALSVATKTGITLLPHPAKISMPIPKNARQKKVENLDLLVKKEALRKKADLLARKKQREMREKQTLLANKLNEEKIQKMRIRRIADEKNTQRKRDEERRARFALKKQEAFQSTKNLLNREIKKIATLLKKRTVSLKKYKNSSSGKVTFQLSKPVSSKGNNGIFLATKVKKAKQMNSLSLVKKEILEIQEKIKSDLTLIDRMNSLYNKK